MHKVIREDNDRFISGRWKEEIVNAVEKDRTFVVVDGKRVDIVSHHTCDDGEKVTIVRVER